MNGWTLTLAGFSAGHGEGLVPEVARLTEVAVPSCCVVAAVDADSSASTTGIIRKDNAYDTCSH